MLRAGDRPNRVPSRFLTRMVLPRRHSDATVALSTVGGAIRRQLLQPFVDGATAEAFTTAEHTGSAAETHICSCDHGSMAGRGRAPRNYRGAVGWGLATAITTFLPILIGLLTADGDVSTSVYGFGALAAIAAAAVATYKFVDDEKYQTSLRIAVQEITHSREQLKLERADTQLTLASVGSGLLAVVERNDDDTLTTFINFLLTSLHDSLRDRGPSRVYFLQSHVATVPDVAAGSGGATQNASFSPRGAVIGHRGTQLTWAIAPGTPDEKVAIDILSRNPPWRDGSLLVADVSDPVWSRFAELKSPDYDDEDPEYGKLKSWCRFGVIGATRQLGLLCVDAWRPNALSGPEDESLIEAFATLLAAGLVLRAGITTSLAAATRSATKTTRGPARSWPGRRADQIGHLLESRSDETK
jgi:hypothetical protein